MIPGYYSIIDGSGAILEIYRVTGRKRGNAYYNPWADNPRWAGIAQDSLPSSEEFARMRYSKEEPKL